MKKLILIALLFLIGKANALTIRGHVLLNEKWESKVYLSEINDINNFFRVSDSTLISESPIDSVGYFEFEIQGTDENRFYRIHFVEKGNKYNSVVTGGKNENFFILILNKRSSVYVSADADNFIGTYEVQGSKECDELRKISTLRKPFYDAVDLLDTKMEKARQSELFSGDSLAKIKTVLFSKICVPAINVTKKPLKKFIRNTPNTLLKVYAAVCIGFPGNYEAEEEFYNELATTFENEKNIYAQQFIAAINDSGTPIMDAQTLNMISILLLVLFALITFKILYDRSLFGKRVAAIKAIPVQVNKENIDRLNMKELEIYMLLHLNRSAKDISESLSLKLYALRQNVNGIYNKLEVKDLLKK